MKDNRDILEFEANGTVVIGCDKEVTNVTIPDGVTALADEAFINCTSLETVTIPNSVTNIGRRAFYNCLSLESINIPNGVTKINDEVFYDCISLKSIVIPGSVTEIKRFAFWQCKSLEKINIPKSVTKIGMRAFSHCNTLETVSGLKGVIDIGDHAFEGCNSLKTINITDSVKKIWKSAFEGCCNLEEINIPSNLEMIEKDAFKDCSKLKRISISWNHPNFMYEKGELTYKKTGDVIAKFDVTESDELQRLLEQLKKMQSEVEQLNEQLEEEKKSHEHTKEKLAELEEKVIYESNNSITIDEMISIIGKQVTAEKAKTISDALTIIVVEKRMKVTEEQNEKMKANLAKLANPSPMVSTGTNSGIMASNINIQMQEENIVDAEVVEEASAQTQDFDAGAVLAYVCQIKEDGEDNNALLVKFWKRLMERSSEMKVKRYNVMKCVFVHGRNEKNVEFSKKFVCCVIGYLKNHGDYTLSHIEISEMLGEGKEPDNARIKNMQQCLRDYDNSVKKVVDEVIQEIFV